jgi:hypothetical protein
MLLTPLNRGCKPNGLSGLYVLRSAEYAEASMAPHSSESELYTTCTSPDLPHSSAFWFLRPVGTPPPPCAPSTLLIIRLYR